jgi:glutamate racemase
MRYLEPLRARDIDTLILGCTHYPLLRDVIETTLPGVTLVDSGAAVAGDLARALARLGIEADGGPAAGPRAAGGARRAATQHAEYYVTDDPERFRDVGVRFLGHDIEGPHLADLTADPTDGRSDDGEPAAGER